jgi:hypothetical protein
MAVAEDIALGYRAIAEVKREIPFGTANRRDGFSGYVADAKTLLMNSNDQFRAWKTANPNATIGQEIAENARLTRLSGVGNCGDQCDLAWQWLTRNGATRLGYIQLQRGHLEHAFLVLGLPARPVDAFTATEARAPPEFGSAAVIVDAWLNVCYQARAVNWRHGFRRMISDLVIASSKNDEPEDDGPALNFLLDQQTKYSAREVADDGEVDLQCIAYFAG